MDTLSGEHAIEQLPQVAPFSGDVTSNSGFLQHHGDLPVPYSIFPPFSLTKYNPETNDMQFKCIGSRCPLLPEMTFMKSFKSVSVSLSLYLPLAS